MKRTYHPRRLQILQLLLANPDGLTRDEVRSQIGITADGFNLVYRASPHIYIDRWVARRVSLGFGGHRVAWVPVYCAVPTLEDAPAPDWPPTEDDVRD